MLTFILQLAGLVVLPAIFCVALWRSQEPDRFRWLLGAAYTGAFVAYMLALGRWDVVSVYLRYALILGYVVALLKSFAAVRSTPWFAPRESGPRWPAYLVYTAVLLFFGASLVWVARGYTHDEQAVELAFPLRDGWFYVGQGGNTTILNYHNSIRAQRYALDIVGLNDLGIRARGLDAKDLSSYALACACRSRRIRRDPRRRGPAAALRWPVPGSKRDPRRRFRVRLIDGTQFPQLASRSPLEQ